MANALEVISREHLECAICCETYKHPRLLPCLHSFCVECLQSYVKEETTTDVVCPVCQQSFPIPDGDVTQFPNNYPLSSLIESIDAKQKELQYTDVVNESPVAADRNTTLKRNCDSCGQNEAVTAARCVDCHHYLCQFCKEAHQRVLAFRGHHVIDIPSPVAQQEVTEKPQTRQEQIQNCSQHPSEQARYFCLPCGVMICPDCAIAIHRSTEHDVVTLKEAVKNRKEYLRQKTIDILGIAAKIDKQDQEITPSGGEGLDDVTEKGKGGVIQNSRRARNACQIVEQALERSSDNDSDFLVLYATLDTMMQQIYDEFIESGYIVVEEQRDNIEAGSLTPLIDAFGSLLIGGMQRSSQQMPPFPRFPHRWRRRFPPPHAPPPLSDDGHAPRPHHPLGAHPFGPHHRPPWFGLAGPRHPRHPHPRRGRGHCHPHRK